MLNLLIVNNTLPQRNLDKIQYIVIHRINVGQDAHSLVREFNKTGKFQAGSYTGGTQPYSFYIDGHGELFQLHPLSRVSQHAVILNTNGIGIAVQGDFTKQKPSTDQIKNLVSLCVAIQLFLGRELKIIGHTDMPGASKDVSKVCPGKYLDVRLIRLQVKEELEYHKTLQTIKENLVPLETKSIPT